MKTVAEKLTLTSSIVNHQRYVTVFGDGFPYKSFPISALRHVDWWRAISPVGIQVERRNEPCAKDALLGWDELISLVTRRAFSSACQSCCKRVDDAAVFLLTCDIRDNDLHAI